jgi:hypothetical protein
MVYNGWGMTVFKLYDIMFKCRQYQYFLVSLRPSHVIVLGCFTLVSDIGIHATFNGVISCNLVAMSPTLVINRRRKRPARTTVIALLLEKSSDFLQDLGSFFKFFC